MARILVAEDDPTVRQLILVTLEPLGYELRGVGDGNAAVRQVEADPPDLMILDVMMPGMDGWSVLKELRRKGLRGATRVLMLTAKSGETDHVEGWNLGVDEYMTKPFDVDELAERVQETLSMTSAQIQMRRRAELEKSNLLSRIETAFGEGEKDSDG